MQISMIMGEIIKVLLKRGGLSSKVLQNNMK